MMHSGEALTKETGEGIDKPFKVAKSSPRWWARVCSLQANK